MNNEYLWNKTGEDPEIEKLEKALAVFRYKEAAAVEPVTRTVHEGPLHWRMSFAFAFAFASFAIIAMLALVVLQVSNNNSNPENAPEIVFVQQSTAAADVDPVVEPKQPTAPNPDGHGRPAGTRRRNVNRTRAAFNRRPVLKDSTPRDSIAALTREERYAYRQLMLALSITGSKLKIVQDTIDGAENTDDNDSKNHR